MDDATADCHTISGEGLLYDLDPVTRRLIFRKNESSYAILRSVFQSVGIDIDAIQTEEDLNRHMDAHSALIYDVSVARSLASQSKSLDRRCLQAITRGDYSEADRLLALIEKRKRLGLTVVSPSSQ